MEREKKMGIGEDRHMWRGDGLNGRLLGRHELGIIESQRNSVWFSSHQTICQRHRRSIP